MTLVRRIAAWFETRVLEPRRAARTRRRISAIEALFHEAEHIASRGDHTVALALFKRAFVQLTLDEQSTVGAPAFLELWNVIRDRLITDVTRRSLPDGEAADLFREGRLETVLLGEADISFKSIVTHFKAQLVVIRVEINIEYGTKPALTIEQLEKIQGIMG